MQNKSCEHASNLCQHASLHLASVISDAGVRKWFKQYRNQVRFSLSPSLSLKKNRKLLARIHHYLACKHNYLAFWHNKRGGIQLLWKEYNTSEDFRCFKKRLQSTLPLSPHHTVVLPCLHHTNFFYTHYHSYDIKYNYISTS